MSQSIALFDIYKALVHYMAVSLELLRAHFGKTAPIFQGHALRRGTVSLLKRLGFGGCRYQPAYWLDCSVPNILNLQYICLGL